LVLSPLHYAVARHMITAPMIELTDLHYVYGRSGTPAVDGLSFQVHRGEIFGLLGPSGAGKSTTQRVLCGLLRGYHGGARVRGKESATWGPDDYERTGVSFETPNHFLKLTALENLRYFAGLYSGPTRAPMALLEALDLQEHAHMRVSEYSKGMKARLSIARSLLCNPDILFLDEPTGGLDPANARRIASIIRVERAAGCTVFLTTHDMMLVEDVCDRIAFMADGRIACIGSPLALKMQHGKRAVCVEYQAEHETVIAEFNLDGLGSNARFLELLRERNIQTIHSREANLADVFIRVTGRGLE
jgi:fluoroquinolone transport system ATP-binding protein